MDKVNKDGVYPGVTCVSDVKVEGVQYLGGQALIALRATPTQKWTFGGEWAEVCSSKQHTPWQSHCALQTFILFLPNCSSELFRITINSHVATITKSIWLSLQMAPHGHPSVLMPGALSISQHRLPGQGLSVGPSLQGCLGSQTCHVLTQGPLTWASG